MIYREPEALFEGERWLRLGTRIMGLDVGEKTIGIALTDTERLIASPAATIRRSNLAVDLAALQTMITQQNVGEIVVGMPRSLSGALHFQAEKTQEFINHLMSVISLPVHTWDERFSTAEASRVLNSGNVRRARQAKVIDQTAAALILQGYLAYQAEQKRVKQARAEQEPS